MINVYTGTPKLVIIVCLSVNDMLIMGNNDKVIVDSKRILNRNFDMKDFGLNDVIIGSKSPKC